MNGSSIAEAYEQLEQQNVAHPATHQVHFGQNFKTTYIVQTINAGTSLSFEGQLATDF